MVDSGQMVIFGPVPRWEGIRGLGVVEAEDEDELRAFAAGDPVVETAPPKWRLARCCGGSSSR